MSHEFPRQPPVLRRRSLSQSVQEELGIGGEEVLKTNHSIVTVSNRLQLINIAGIVFPMVEFVDFLVFVTILFLFVFKFENFMN